MLNAKTQTLQNRPIVSGLSRPNWICRRVKQAVVLVRDKSSSMEGKKAEDASAACADLVNELGKEENKDGFFVGVVDFSERAETVHDLTRASELDGQVEAIVTESCTNITEGLRKALRLLKSTSQLCGEEATFLKPVTLLFSDGCHNDGKPPHSIGKKLKGESDLVTIAFGEDADEDLLKKLATTPQHFYRCKNGRELRDFMSSVGPTLSQSLAAGVNATDSLSGMQ
jgi:uncharacterized protein YegL